MPNWNPNAPATIGLEWFAATESSTSLDSGSAAAIQTLPSLAAQTIETVRVGVPGSSSPGAFLLEIMPTGSEVCAAPTTSTFRPNEDSQVFNAERQDGSLVNLWQAIDEAVLDTADYVRTITPSPFGHLYAYKLNTATFPATGRRIVDVRYVFVGEQVADRSTWVVELRKQDALGVGMPGFVEFFRTSLDSSQGRQTFTASLGPINPFTGRPWTGAQIQTLDSTVDPSRLSIRHRWVDEATATAEARLYQAYLEVVWVPENRVAWGAAQLPVGSTPSWQSIVVRNAADALTWAKPAGGSFSYLLRRIQPPTTPGATIGNPIRSAEGAISWRWLDSGDATPTGMDSYLPTIDGNGCVSDLGTARTRAYSIVPALAGPVASLDAQPFVTYEQTLGIWIGLAPTTQEITTGPAGTYELVRALLLIDDDRPPTDDLTIRVRRSSDNLQFGSTITLTPAQLVALPRVGGQGWRLIEEFFSAAPALAAATQYYIELDSDTSSSNPLYAAALTSFLDPTFWSSPTFNGSTDVASIAGLSIAAADLAATLSDAPTTPGMFGTSIQIQALSGSGDGCSVAEMEYVEATWTATALGANFDRYEIERSEDGGVSWQQIGRIDDEATTTFGDYEGLRGVEACYRVRVVRLSDQVPSPWTVESCETPQAADCEVLFVSNVEPLLNVGYDDQTPRTYEFQDAAEVVFYPVFGRDRQVAFAPLERLGDRWTMNLTINAVETPTPEGRRVFDEILAISLAPIPYVAVLDSDGNRWLGALQVPEGTRTEPGKLYVVPATITETTVVPTVVVLP